MQVDLYHLRQSNHTGSSLSDLDDACNQTVFQGSTQQKLVSTGH